MTSDLWRRAKEVFLDALEASEGDREALVASRTAGDPELAAEVRALLAAEEGAGEFLEPPPLAGLGGPPEGGTTAPGAAFSRRRVPELRPGAVLAGRYEVGERIGAGSFGAVHRGKDRITGEPVALKVLAAGSGALLDAYRREASLLRLVRIPGVAALLDDGVEEGNAWIALTLVEGTPFPGRPAPVPWGTLAPTARAMLEALGALHRLGVFHGDLKPANVLVDGRGVPTLLDLGVARERAEEMLLAAGTPAWLAPERFGGGPPDERSDLYAVGVMLYEALAGRPPHEGDRMTRLAASRRAGAARPLGEAAPGVPPSVASVVDALLSPDPARRPSSAAAAAAALFPAGAGTAADPVLAEVREVLSGRLPGGSSGVLGEEALRPLFAGPDRIFHLREDAARELHGRTGGEPGRVEEELARWVRSGLARSAGGVLSVPRGSLVRLRAEREREAWLGGESPGTADGRARIRRRALAAEPLSEERFFLLAAAEEAEEAAREAASLGRRLEGEGRVEDALGVYEEALALLRRSGARPDLEERVLLSYMQTSAYTATLAGGERLIYHAGRCALRTPLVEAVEALARAGNLSLRGEGGRALALVETVPEGLDPDIDYRIQAERWLAIRVGNSSLNTFRSAALLCLRWARRKKGARARRFAHSVLGGFRYREGRFSAAMRCARARARLNDFLAGRAQNLVSLASNALEAFEPEHAEEGLRESGEILRTHRIPLLEAYWETMRRYLAYRRDEGVAPDPDLQEAARTLERGDFHGGVLLLQEAALAWRRGLPGAADLAEEAAEAFRASRGRWGPEMVARGLALAAGAAPDPGEAASLAERGAGIQVPGVALQVLGLVGLLRTGASGRWLERARECAGALDQAHLEVRREVLSAGEALRAVEEDAGIEPLPAERADRPGGRSR